LKVKTISANGQLYKLQKFFDKALFINIIKFYHLRWGKACNLPGAGAARRASQASARLWAGLWQ
jgi:hypothetical protein